jgi:DNA-binding PadR family transcriptional regulator
MRTANPVIIGSRQQATLPRLPVPPRIVENVSPSERFSRRTALVDLREPGKTLLLTALDYATVVHRYTDYRSFMPKRKLDPLPSAAFQILLSLAGEDLHGYGIMRQVAEQTGGRMRLGPGTLYSSIQSLLEEKFIEEVDAREDTKLGHERRRYYRLTSAGRKLARTEADRLAGWLRVARAKKILKGDYV